MTKIIITKNKVSEIHLLDYDVVKEAVHAGVFQAGYDTYRFLYLRARDNTPVFTHCEPVRVQL